MTSPQAPIASPFGYRSTALEVVDGIDLSGKVALVTGGYSGLGTETVRALAAAGARVIVAARRPDKAAQDLADVAGEVSIVALDLSDPASIDACAAEVSGLTDRLHIVINNAAIMANPLTRDARGYESQFATNHLGHFQLIARLWPLLKAGGADGGARLVSVSSIGHRRSDVVLDDLNFERREYEKWSAYGQAKSANALFALHLDKLGAPHGVRAFSVHPGGIATPLQRHLSMEEQKAMGWYDDEGKVHPAFKTPAEGASTAVWCATSPLLAGMGGVYCEDCNIAELAGPDTPPMSGAMPWIGNPDSAAALWTRSEELTGVAFRP
jgi:NAD(P)-dependent dehydrogenase (short-subunit alcohol dehydrogenase family)